MHHAYKCLAGRQAADHFLAKRFFLDPRDKIPHHRQGNIGLQERQADLAQHVLSIGFCEACLTPHGLDDTGETLGEIFKHDDGFALH